MDSLALVLTASVLIVGIVLITWLLDLVGSSLFKMPLSGGANSRWSLAQALRRYGRQSRPVNTLRRYLNCIRSRRVLKVRE